MFYLLYAAFPSGYRRFTFPLATRLIKDPNQINSISHVVRLKLRASFFGACIIISLLPAESNLHARKGIQNLEYVKKCGNRDMG
jgi:hypothetical protein